MSNGVPPLHSLGGRATPTATLPGRERVPDSDQSGRGRRRAMGAASRPQRLDRRLTGPWHAGAYRPSSNHACRSRVVSMLLTDCSQSSRYPPLLAGTKPIVASP